MAKRNILLVVEYDGTEFSGWQRQVEERTVQGELERALREVAGEELTVAGAGRTDAGVHAWGQVAVFLTKCQMPPEAFAPALNSILPADVSVVESREVPREFHPRKDAEGKIYLYRVLNRLVRPAVERRRVWHVHVPLDVELMREGARHLVGFHDFTSFATGRRGKNNYRELWRLDVSGRAEGEIEFVLEGSGFLYQMVRTIVGSLVEVGRGKEKPGWTKEALDARDRTAAGPTAPPWGLYLVRVNYEGRDSSVSST